MCSLHATYTVVCHSDLQMYILFSQFRFFINRLSPKECVMRYKLKYSTVDNKVFGTTKYLPERGVQQS